MTVYATPEDKAIAFMKRGMAIVFTAGWTYILLVAMT